MFKNFLLKLPKLIFVLGILSIGFSLLSGLLSLLAFYVLFSGLPESERRLPVLVCIAAVLVLSLPFFTSAICGFVSGEHSFKRLLGDSLKPGKTLYLKFLALGAAAYGLSYLIRLLPVLGLPALQILLTAVIFACLLPVSYHVYKRDISFLAPESAKNREVLSLTDMRVS